MSNKDEEKVVSIGKEKDNRTIYRVCKNRDNPYVMLNKGFFEDPFISLKSKGLLGYLLSKPDNWIVYRSEILKHCTDGIDSLKAAMKELKQAGYMKIEPERNEDGKIVRWLTVVFEAPQPTLKPIPKLPEAENPPLAKNRKKPEVENPQVGFATCGKPATTNNDLVLNNKNTNNNQPTPEPQNPSSEPDANVVVSLMEKLEQWAIAETLLRTWLKKHSAEYILCKIEYTKSYATKNPAGLLRRAIENDYKLPVCKQAKLEPKPPAEPMYPTHEENLAWYAGLSDEEKQRCFSEATRKHPHFEEMLKIEKINFKSVAFLKTTWFKMMMQIIGRAN